MAFTKTQVMQLYERRARRYDTTANLYYALGFRETPYRKKAVEALHLHEGDTVVELGCGTGLNFSFLEKAVGPRGRIVGVDLTARMLDVALKRIERRGWDNVKLVREDAARYRFPRQVDGILSTLALTLIPEYDAIIRRASAALPPGKRLVLLDLQQPPWLPGWLLDRIIPLVRPFGVTADLAERHAWESVVRHFKHHTKQDYFGGIVYLAVGWNGP